MTKLQHVCIALSVTAMLTFPLTRGMAQDNVTGKVEADIVYGHKDGLAMTMDIHRPEVEANGATILFMMSGGWFSRWAPPEQTRPLFAPYLAHGYNVVAVRHGSSPRYGIPEAVADVRQAIRFVHTHGEQLGLDASRLGVMGMSAGGHLALMLGTTGDDGDASAKDRVSQASSRVNAVVALVPPTDLRVMVWDAPESLPVYKNFPALNLAVDEATQQSPLTHVTADDAPALVFMGGRDDLVPVKHGKWIDDAYQKEQVEHKLIVFPDAGHGLGGDGNRETMVREIIAWFDQHLNPQP